MTTRRAKHPAGLLGDKVTIEFDGAPGEREETLQLLVGLSPSARIAALRRHPSLVATADELEGRLRGRRKTADIRLLHDIMQAEFRALDLTATPKVVRDNRRQAGTKKARRPELQRWIQSEIDRQTGETTQELWDRAPEWLTDEIGFHRFTKRVTEARKTRVIGRK